MIRSLLRRMTREDEGTTAAEYAIMLVLILCALISAVNVVGTATATIWGKNVNAVGNALSGSGS